MAVAGTGDRQRHGIEVLDEHVTQDGRGRIRHCGARQPVRLLSLSLASCLSIDRPGLIGLVSFFRSIVLVSLAASCLSIVVLVIGNKFDGRPGT